MRQLFLIAATFVLAACGSQPPRPVESRSTSPVVAPAPSELPSGVSSSATAQSAFCARPPCSAVVSAPAVVSSAPTGKTEARKPTVVTKRGGGYYQDDGPGDHAPTDLDAIPDATPRAEPLHRFANNPYSVLGRDYTPMKSAEGYQARGIASWYGRKFHGQKTSSGEPYDMYGMTAAHPNLPIPSYVRVSNPANGKSVVVRVNDRGPFHAGRIIDLSYTAAWKLDYIGDGSTQVVVESVMPGQDLTGSNQSDARMRPLRFENSDGANLPIPKPLPTVTGVGGHFVQLGAFGNRDNADALRAHLSRELGELADKLVINSAGNLHRVQLGPWPDVAAARRAAQTLTETFNLASTVVMSPPSR